MKFAVYFIPQPGSFYTKGSQILGYDIRSEKALKSPAYIQNGWTEYSRKYGFHLTITDAVKIKPDKLTQLEIEFQDILRCFGPNTVFELIPYKNPVIFWGVKSDQAAIRFRTNLATKMLHTILVSILHKQGYGSLYSELLLSRKIILPENDPNYFRIKKFFSPNIFDNFKPHMTLVNPYTSNKTSSKKAVANSLAHAFKLPKHIRISSLCLVVQERPSDYFKIYREFKLG